MPRIPADPEHRNDERAQWAALAIEASYDHDDNDDADQESRLSDLLASLAHYCDRNGINFAERLQMAMTHYEDEAPDGTQFETIAFLS